MKKIVIDILGSDLGTREMAKGACLAARAFPEVKIVLVGPEKENSEAIVANDGELRWFEFIDADSVFSNEISSKEIVYGYDDSSLALSLKKLKEDEEAFALISAGSTGGLLVGSIFRLGLLPHVKFPALAANLMHYNGHYFTLLDCGANLDVDAKMLTKFAKMGASLISSSHGVEEPRIGLLNVGKEEGKGNALAKEAYELLKGSSLNFVGNIEGSDIFLGKCDVLVSDGFSGNAILKNTEAVASIAEEILKDGHVDEKVIYRLHSMFAYKELGASILLGPRKICLKPHGSSSASGILSSVELALRLEKNSFIERLAHQLEQ